MAITTQVTRSPSCEDEPSGITRQDGWSVCLPVLIEGSLYTDGLSDELPFFPQVRPRRMIRL